jgi:hypothetical protein
VDRDEELRRGEQAQALLEHPLLVEAFEKIEQEVTDAWKTSPQRDVDGRERLHLTICLLHKLKEQIQEVAETGQLVRQQNLIEMAKAKVSKIFNT